MRTNRDSGFPYLIIGVGFGLLAGGILWSTRGRIPNWGQVWQGTRDGLDYLSGEGEKVRASADEFVGKTKEWLTRFNTSLRGTAQRGNTNSGESPGLD